MRRTPKIATVKPAALGTNLDLAVSGKNIFHGKSGNELFGSQNEFTFSPNHFDGSVAYKKSAPKNPFEKNLAQDKNLNESMTKNEIFDRLGIKNPEAEQVADLSIHSMVMGGGSNVPKSKKDVTNNLISNLETEIEKLKYKRDNYIADKENKRREQILNSRKLPAQDEETNIVIHKDEERMQQVLHPISSLEKPTLENVEALLRAHKEKMQDLERNYMQKRKQNMLNSDFEYEPPVHAESVKNAPIQSIRVPEELRSGKENYERPKSAANPYMSQKEYNQKKKHEAEALKIQKKKEDERNYHAKFKDYLYDKRDYLDYKEEEERERGEPLNANKDFDRYQPTSPNPKRSKSRNKWDVDNIVEEVEVKRSKSPNKEGHHGFREEHERPKTAKTENPKRASRFGFGDNSPGKSPSRERMRSSSPGRKSIKIKDTHAENVDISEQEVKLLHFVFNMMRKNGEETVDKEDICDYVLRSPEILELYEIDATNLRNNLYGFPTKDRDSVFFEEFLSFLENSRAGNIDRVNTDMNQSNAFRKSASKNRKSTVKFSPERKSMKAPKVENACMLADETLDTIREVFNEVDKHEDLIVKRQALVKRLREDVRIMRILHKPAVHIVEIDKYLTMERLLRQIEEEETNAIGEQKRAKEYISLNQFLKYFTNYETPDDLAEKMGEFNKTQSTKKSPSRSTRGFDEDDQDIIEVAAKHMQFFKDIFDSMPKKRQAFAETMSFIDSIRGDDRYVLGRRDPARRKSQHFELESENIEQTLNRLEMEAEKYISWDDFVQFFTRRGRPKRLLTTTYNVEQDLIQSGLASDPQNKGMQTGAKIIQNKPRDGYDSDPEFHTYSKQVNYEFKLNRSPQTGEIEEMRSSKEKSPQKRTRGESPKSVGVQNDYEHSHSPNNIRNTFTERPTRTEAGDGDGQWHERRSRRKTEGMDESGYNSRFGAAYKDPRDLKYTVPDPFEFDTREKVRAKSIRERKVEEMVQEKIDEEERILNHRFRANSVPGIVKTPLFEKIIHNQEERRAQVKKNSVAITKMREAPFNFYLRDKDKPPKPEYQLNDEFGKRFKAKPIPAICQLTDVWVNMKEREDIERKERVARLAQQNLLLASLPPRMAKHEKEKKEQELRSQINEKNMERQKDRKTFVANEVPNFDRLHKQFQDLLDRKRSNKRPTETRPFAFQESKKGVMRDYLDVENQYKKAAKDETRRDPFESVRKLKSIKPKMQPHTTKKMIALSDLRKKEREEKQRKAEQLEKEEEERRQRYQKMKPLVQGSSAIQDRTEEKDKRAKEIKEEVKKRFVQDQRNFEDKKRAIEENVAKRPLLVEQVSGKSQKQQLQAMHDLNKLNKIMKDAGVRDPKTYFSQDERDKIEDAEYLEKRGFKEFRKSDD